MPIVGTFNGLNIVSLPCDTWPGVVGPSSIEWDEHEVVASRTSSFTGESQTYDWRASWWEGQVSFPPMTRYSHDAWSAFLSQCRGESNAFMLGDPKAKLPKGSALGSPQVRGDGQSGYALNTRGWNPGIASVLLFGDFIQIGYRLYKVLDAANSDGSRDGLATLAIWPPLRDLPADGTSIIARQCKGLFKLKNNNGNKHSTNAGNYGLSGFAIKEAI